MIIKANHYLKKLLLSIIIPTHNSEHTIKGCINSLISQSYPREKFEIIVVDDGSTDKTISLAKNAGVDKIIEIQSCFQGKARNIGVENSKTEYLAFIDSDCHANEGWIKTIVENLSHVKIITGPIENGNPKSMVAWSEYLVEFGQFHKFRRKSKVRWLPGCNLACTKEVFLKTGGFTEIRSSEDLIFGESLRDAGLDAFFIPSLEVKHLCRTNLKKVLANNELLGKYTIRAVKQASTINYGHLLSKRKFIPIVFFGRIAKSISYAIKGKKAGKFFLLFPLVVLILLVYCKGLWIELGVKQN